MTTEQGLWAFYRAYTNTAIHTAATAALAIFGVLVFVDPLFAILAIASYLLPPTVLYSWRPELVRAVGDGQPATAEDSTELRSDRPRRGTLEVADLVDERETDSDAGDGDTDTDGTLDSDTDAAGSTDRDTDTDT